MSEPPQVFADAHDDDIMPTGCGASRQLGMDSPSVSVRLSVPLPSEQKLLRVRLHLVLLFAACCGLPLVCIHSIRWEINLEYCPIDGRVLPQMSFNPTVSHSIGVEPSSKSSNSDRFCTLTARLSALIRTPIPDFWSIPSTRHQCPLACVALQHDEMAITSPNKTFCHAAIMR